MTISARTPNLCHLAPAGNAYMEDLDEAGGVYAVMNELDKKGLLKTDIITCTGKTVGENIEDCINKTRILLDLLKIHIVRPAELQFLNGNLAPDSCVVKRSAVCCRNDKA